MAHLPSVLGGAYVTPNYQVDTTIPKFKLIDVTVQRTDYFTISGKFLAGSSFFMQFYFLSFFYCGFKFCAF